MWAQYFSDVRQAFFEFLNFKILGFPVYDYCISVLIGTAIGSFFKSCKKILDI